MTRACGMQGCVALWDVLLGQEVESFGVVDFDTKEKELFKPMAVPAWFACDTKLGTLTVHLEPPSCFGAEAYAGGCNGTGEEASCFIKTYALKALLLSKPNSASILSGWR